MISSEKLSIVSNAHIEGFLTRMTARDHRLAMNCAGTFQSLIGIFDVEEKCKLMNGMQCAATRTRRYLVIPYSKTVTSSNDVIITEQCE